jgi:hypothetical protein
MRFVSEFLSICPKCHQRILCDTAYIGMRVACPLCMQEITMPELPVEGLASTTVSAQTTSASTEPLGASAGKRLTAASMIAGGAVLILIIGGGIWLLHGRTRPAPPPPHLIASPAKPPTQTPINTPATTAKAPEWISSPSVTVVSLRPSMAAGSRPVSISQSTVPSEPKDTCCALWTFDRVNGIMALDESGHGNNLALVGDNASWTQDAKVGAGALKLSGSSYAETAGPVVDTSRSFTVAAWVNFSAIEKKGCQTVVAIDGTKVSAFYLQLNHLAGDRFVFARREKDDDELHMKSIWARSGAAVVRNAWYHLAGVYDAAAQTISLYVNGKLQESTPFTSAWRATGKTSVGRGLYSQTNSDFVRGTVDDVRIYAAALTADQIQALAVK